MWSYQDGRADAIGRIAEPIVCCGSECDGTAETIVFYDVERVRIADTIGRIAETIVLCGSERGGRGETIAFYEVERIRITGTIGRIAETIVFCGSEHDGRADTIEKPKLSYFTGPEGTEEPKAPYFARWKLP